MRKTIALFLTVSLCLGMLPAVFAADTDTDTERDTTYQEELAVQLKSLNLFSGVSENDFALDRAPTRLEAMIILIKLMGKADEAVSCTEPHPFTDVPAWANGYIAYAYSNGLTSGTSATTFGRGPASAASFTTFVLRALGYSDADGDFTWKNPYDLADEIGLETENVDTENVLRADAVYLCYKALSADMKGTDVTLADTLIDAGVFTEEEYTVAMENMDAASGNASSEEVYYDNSSDNIALYNYSYDASLGGYVITGFAKSGKKDIIFPSEYNGKPVVGIGTAAFQYTQVIKSVTIHGGIMSLGKNWLKCQLGVKFILDPANTEYVLVDDIWLLTADGKSVVGCDGSAKGDVIIPDGVESIGILDLGDGGNKLPTVGTSPDLVNGRLYIPASLNIDMDVNSLQNVWVGGYVVDPDNPYICSVDGVIYSKDMTKLIRYPEGNMQTSFNIPDGVTTVGKSAFRNHTYLDDISIPSSIISIEEGAFSTYANKYGDSYTIHLPGSVLKCFTTSACSAECVEVLLDISDYSPSATYMDFDNNITAVDDFSIDYVNYLDYGNFYALKIGYSNYSSNRIISVFGENDAWKNTGIHIWEEGTAERTVFLDKYKIDNYDLICIRLLLNGYSGDDGLALIYPHGRPEPPASEFEEDSNQNE